MANALVTAWLNGQLGAGAYTALDFDGLATLKLACIDHGVATPLPASMDMYDDFSAGLVTGGLSTAMTSVTVGVSGIGAVDCADLTPAWTGVSGASVESVNLINDTGTPSTSKFICYWDTGVAFTPNGGNVNLAVNGSGLFKI